MYYGFINKLQCCPGFESLLGLRNLLKPRLKCQDVEKGRGSFAVGKRIPQQIKKTPLRPF